ncbi:MAG: threonylcarbamoyl-AMP synthase [Chlorobi bacterium]|nr:threonylcarbamoyl-AMP synthase [Chlorobiota bacterium]
MGILKANSANIERAAEVIKSGGIVAFPTETVYGLGANGFDAEAVARIFEAKNRPSFNPLIMHISDVQQLDDIVVIKNSVTEKLIEKFWPGPLTLVLEKTKKVPAIVTSGHPTVAVRMPDHKTALELIFKAGMPIAAPSANQFGKLSPTEAEHVEEQLGDKVDIILDGGHCDVGIESTIVQITSDDIFLLRHGGLPIEEIEETLGREIEQKVNNVTPNSPGQLPYHYAPDVPIVCINDIKLSDLKGKKIGALFFKEQNLDFPFVKIKVLSPTGNLREAAANLFSFIHELEHEDIDLILCEKIGGKELGHAIDDRLTKAAKKFI